MDESEFAARRKELEREFEDKARDLKAQDARRRAALEQERTDWETARREKEKGLSDRAEKARRQDENIKRDLEALKVARRELEAMQGLGQEKAAAQAEAKAAQATGAQTEARLGRTHSLLGAAILLWVVWSIAVLYAAVVTWPERVVAGLAGVSLALALLVAWRRSRLAR